MLPVTEIYNNLRNVEYTTIKTNRRIEYLNLSCGLDIETTSHKIGDVKVAFSYIWMLGLGHGEPIYYGRTWEELIKICSFLQLELNLNSNRRLVVYIHNMAYEFQFMYKHFKWDYDSIFSIAERKPIKALCSYGIEFRDSYILSGFSLENTAKNLVKNKVSKLVGNLDYSLIRTPKTPLTELEMAYCENDIKIITSYIDEQIDLYGDITKIPMTNTGRVRNYVRDKCYYTSKNHRKSSKGKYIKYKKIMSDLTLDSETYIQLKRAFMGGFTHANANYSGKVLENVSSVDFTSSYPSVMISEKFPMSRFKKIEIDSISQLEEYCLKYALIMDIKFINIESKISYENYISESKCVTLIKPTINNGRVFRADELTTTITEIDYDIINKTYSFDEVMISNVRMAHKNYLPKPIIEAILKLYEDKTVLKDVEGYETEYLLSKGMLNSIYGMCVTDIMKDETTFNDGEWSSNTVNIDDEIDKYNTSKKRFLYYPWGIWVTAYARKNLWTGIQAAEDDYVYSDTDSLKVLNYEKHLKYVEWYNNQIIMKMNDMCDYYNLDKNLLNPKTKHGVNKMMGVWDFEGTYSKFKTLGAKRYLVLEKNDLKLTLAGLSKQNGIKYMLEVSNNDVDSVFNMFNSELTIPAEKTGKMTHTYIDSEYKFKIIDYLGNESIIDTKSGIHLEKCEFTLSISKQYSDFINNLKSGYFYKGVNYQ